MRSPELGREYNVGEYVNSAELQFGLSNHFAEKKVVCRTMFVRQSFESAEGAYASRLGHSHLDRAFIVADKGSANLCPAK